MPLTYTLLPSIAVSISSLKQHFSARLLSFIYNLLFLLRVENFPFTMHEYSNILCCLQKRQMFFPLLVMSYAKNALQMARGPYFPFLSFSLCLSIRFGQQLQNAYQKLVLVPNIPNRCKWIIGHHQPNHHDMHSSAIRSHQNDIMSQIIIIISFYGNFNIKKRKNCVRRCRQIDKHGCQ